MDEAKAKQIDAMSAALEKECGVLIIYFVHIRSRLELGLPIDETMRIIDEKLQTIVYGVECLKEECMQDVLSA